MSGALISTCDCCCDGDVSDCNDMGYSGSLDVTLSGLTVCTGCCLDTSGPRDVSLSNVSTSVNGTFTVPFLSANPTLCIFQGNTSGTYGDIKIHNTNDGSCGSVFVTENLTAIQVECHVYRVSGVVARLCLTTLPSGATVNAFIRVFEYGRCFLTGSDKTDIGSNPTICEELTNQLTSCSPGGNCNDTYSHSGTAVIAVTP